MKWDKWAVIIAAIAFASQIGLSAITGGFSITNRIENLTAEIKLLRHEVVAQNALQDAEISSLKARLTSKT